MNDFSTHVLNQRSLFPGAHVCVDSHTVVGSVSQLFLTNLGTAKQNKAKEQKQKFRDYMPVKAAMKKV